MDVLVGYRTALGIVLAFLGSAGAFERMGVTQAEFASFMDQCLVFGGLVYSFYRNWKNHQEGIVAK